MPRSCCSTWHERFVKGRAACYLIEAERIKKADQAVMPGPPNTGVRKPQVIAENMGKCRPHLDPIS